MNEEQITRQIEIIKKATEEAAKSKKTVRKFLRDAGIPIGDEPFEKKRKQATHA